MTVDRISDLIIHFIKLLDELNNLLTIIQGIGIALLTILIPLAIAILADIYQKRREDKREFTDLDLHVILDSVFNIKLIILSVFLIFLPMFFWEISSRWIRLVEIILSFFGIYLITRTIITKVYRWVKGNVFKLRFSYLKKLRNHDDLEISYRSVWQAKNINIQNEREFFKIFSTAIDQLLKSTEKNKNLKTISKLLSDFYNFINNRSTAFLVIPEDAFPKILKWHFEIWQKKYELSGRKDKLGEWSNYSEISRILNDIFNNIEERSLEERMAYSFFEHFKKHIKDCKKGLVKDASKQDYYKRYIDSLFIIFCRVFFENIEKSPEKHDIWEFCFPEEWKITKNNLENKENIISKTSLNTFLQWAQVRILQAKEDFDRDLDEVSSNLFSELEPTLWAMFLIFIFSGYRVKSVIERSRNFGFIGRVRIYSGDIANSKEESRRKRHEAMQLAEEAEMKNTFELACFLFKEQFLKENLEKYIKSLQDLKLEYKENLKKEEKRLELLNIFERMLGFLNSQETQNRET